MYTSVLYSHSVHLILLSDTWSRYTADKAPILSTEGNCPTNQCIGPGLPLPKGRLADGDLGPADLDMGAVHAWNESVNILFDLVATTRVTALNLYFYNIPSMGSGLPYEIELFRTETNLFTNPVSISYTITGNQDLSQEDNMLRNITLVDTSGESDYRYFWITFTFSTMNRIDLLLLSEVELCDGIGMFCLLHHMYCNYITQMIYLLLRDSHNIILVDVPNLTPIVFADSSLTEVVLDSTNVVSNLNLTCSVTNEGLFQWNAWVIPAGGQIQEETLIVDTSRTSIIMLSQISTTYAGEYQCEVNYATPNIPSSINITLTLGGELSKLCM